jgi:ABC-type dipeptide/oligopeptide/nickel transport system ATPase subunit
MKIDILREVAIEQTVRVQQVSAMFDAPASEKSRVEWHGEIPIEREDWNVGLIVGPSGTGKSTIAKQLFGKAYEPKLKWTDRAVIDDCGAGMSVEAVSQAFSSVGFNSVPSWLRPYAVLSGGERFRVELARRLLELPDPIIVDEFSSVVDRQVAQIASYAVQKYVRKHKRKFVAISCHFDIAEWLQPDWVFEPSTMAFTPGRLLWQRPQLDVTICRVSHSAWRLFAPFHYMSADLHPGARCFGLFVGDRLTTFAGILPKPVSNGADRGTAIAGVSRVVTLPDWQGLGLAFVLLEKLGAAYRGIGKRFRNYPAHPAFVRAHRPSTWRLEKKAGQFSALNVQTGRSCPGWGGRPCAVFEFIGAPMNRDDAEMLLALG